MKNDEEITEAPKLQYTNHVVLELYVQSGGRCEFQGCNTLLLEDELTTNEVKLGNIAHIVARKKGGARGEDPLPFSRRNDIENLMLLCPTCHTLIDNSATAHQYPKETLEKYKQDHEARIKYLTGLTHEHETTVLRIIGNIRGDSVSVSHEDVRMAVIDNDKYPRYLGDGRGIEIDLQSIPETNYWSTATDQINNVITRQIFPAIEDRTITHLSLFPLARIPLLIHLGNSLGDKITTDLYQYHRDHPQGWKWRLGDTNKFDTKLIRAGLNKEKVALILSLSGKILSNELPDTIDDQYYIYEIEPITAEPGRSLFNTKETLTSFQTTYQLFLRMIEKDHGKNSNLHLFPAIAAPVAITCGRELLKDVSPALHVYDRTQNGFEFALTVN